MCWGDALAPAPPAERCCPLSLTLLVLQVDVSACVYQQLHTLGVANSRHKVESTAGTTRSMETADSDTASSKECWPGPLLCQIQLLLCGRRHVIPATAVLLLLLLV